MKDKAHIGDILNELSFTNKELAERVGVSESAIKKIRSGRRRGSREVQRKISQFIMERAGKAVNKLKTNGFNRD